MSCSGLLWKVHRRNPKFSRLTLKGDPFVLSWPKGWGWQPGSRHHLQPMIYGIQCWERDDMCAVPDHRPKPGR
jgi:hypothetical protein